MQGVEKIVKKDKITEIRLYTPEHKNSFFMQMVCFLFYALQSFYYSYKFSNKYDVVFSTSSRLGTGLLGSIISKVFNKKFTLDIRDVFSDSLKSLTAFNTFFGKIFVKLIKKIESIICMKSSWLNFVSPGFLKYPHINPTNKKINLFTNGIDSIFLENPAHHLRTINSPIVITYAGNIGYGQGLEKTVIPIAEYFKNDILFKLVGDGSSVDFIKASIIENSIDNIKIFKPIKRDRLLDLYNGSDILFLQLNKVKAFEHVLPSKIFDYGSFNKPILAGVSGTAKKFLKENLDGVYIFPPDNYSIAIKKIKQIRNDEKKRNR